MPHAKKTTKGTAKKRPAPRAAKTGVVRTRVVGAPKKRAARPKGPPLLHPVARGPVRSLDVPPAAQAVASHAIAIPPPVVVATADPSLMRMLAFGLEQARLPHVAFSSGTRLLQELLGMPVASQPAVIVLDIDLPGVDGQAILERLGAERPNAFLVIVLSAHFDESVQVRSLAAGALDHVAKPFNIRVLMAKVLRWVTVAGRTRSAA